MNETLCPLVRDLAPLYQEGLVSGETREMIELHMAQCDACAALYRAGEAALPQVEPPEPDEGRARDVLARIRRSQNRIKYFTVLLAEFAAVWAFFALDTALSMVPLLVLFPLVLTLLFGDVKTVLFAAVIADLIVGTLGVAFGYALIMLPATMIGTLGGALAGYAVLKLSAKEDAM